MKLPLIALATLALTGAAVAQPPGAGPGPGRGGPFGLFASDTNGDGKLTRAEFDAGQKARFSQIDINKDGSATPEELETFHEARSAEMRAEMSKVRFDALDTDKNGQISRNEFTARPKADNQPGKASFDGPRGGHGGKRGHGAHGSKGDHAMRRDANNDKAVSFTEFSARGVEAFTRADTNKDGTVTLTELQARMPGRL
jgi:EF-hand domain pair/EF hand